MVRRGGQCGSGREERGGREWHPVDALEPRVRRGHHPIKIIRSVDHSVQTVVHRRIVSGLLTAIPWDRGTRTGI